MSEWANGISTKKEHDIQKDVTDDGAVPVPGMNLCSPWTWHEFSSELPHGRVCTALSILAVLW